jgi:hypothetical protein
MDSVMNRCGWSCESHGLCNGQVRMKQGLDWAMLWIGVFGVDIIHGQGSEQTVWRRVTGPFLAVLDPNSEKLVLYIPFHVNCGIRPSPHHLLRQDEAQIL